MVAFSTKLKLDLFTAKEQKRLAFSVPLLEAPRIIDFFFDYFFLAREEKKVIAFGQEGLVPCIVVLLQQSVVVDIFFRCAFSLLYLFGSFFTLLPPSPSSTSAFQLT